MKPARSDYGIYTPVDVPAVQRNGDSEVPIHGPQSDEGPADTTGVAREVKASVRVLIIDDDRTLREGCATVLQVEGYNVTVCGRGDEALEMMRRAHFDIVLVDLFMTPVGGMDILKSVLTIRPNTIVIMMTGNASVSSSVEALRIGAWDYLPKPFSGTHLQLLFGRAAVAVVGGRERETSRPTSCSRLGTATSSRSSVRHRPSAAPSTWPDESRQPTHR